VTHEGAACDAASIHFGLTVRRTDILLFACRYPVLEETDERVTESGPVESNSHRMMIVSTANLEKSENQR